MAAWHLRELEHRLAQGGWRIVRVLPGDGYRVSATWEIERGRVRHLIDFDGLDDMRTLPLERAYGCGVRERTGVSLYFGRRADDAHPNRAWSRELEAFVAALDELEPAAPRLGVRAALVPSRVEAEVACGLLRSAGIECASRATDLSADSFGGWREILVREQDLEDARELLASVRTGQ